MKFNKLLKSDIVILLFDKIKNSEDRANLYIFNKKYKMKQKMIISQDGLNLFNTYHNNDVDIMLRDMIKRIYSQMNIAEEGSTIDICENL